MTTSQAFEESNTEVFLSLERQRTNALVQRDLATVRALHAPCYQLVTPAGRSYSLEEYVDLLRDPLYTAWDIDELAVRRGTDMALIRYKARLCFASGREVTCWHTDSYEIVEARWRAVWSQATEIRG